MATINPKLDNAIKYAKIMKDDRFGESDNYKNIHDRKSKKRDWLKKARNYKILKPAKELHACYICGKYNFVTEAHHLLELNIQYRMGVSEPCHDVVWLCPTHHVIIHKLNGDSDSAVEKISESLSDYEIDAYMELLVMKNRIKQNILNPSKEKQ